MHISVPPEVTITPNLQAVTSGVSNLALTCAADGDKPLDVTWLKDGEPVVTYEQIAHNDKNILTIQLC